MKDPHLNKEYYKKNIALVGHMGSGKSSIGKLISNKLNIDFVESDQLIEIYAKKTINNLFDLYGEAYFRKIEKKIILDLQHKNNIVLSLGGGSILNEEVREFIKNNFISVFLDVDIATLIDRLKYSKKRPLILNTDIGKKIKELDTKRRKYYLLADIILTKYNSSSETLSQFLEEYNRFNEKNN
jgi:shikimate kinase